MRIKFAEIKFTGIKKPVEPDARKEFLRILALECLDIILERTESGKKIGGGRFRSYDPAYFEWKKKKGRSPESTGDWLTFTGQMLGSAGILNLSPEEFLLGFSGGRPKDGFTNAYLAWLNHKVMDRPFFGLTQKEKKIAITRAKEQAKRINLFGDK